jgi:hypothetical protein
MKRRFFALLTVPALAVSFAFASAGTDEAHAYSDPGLGPSLMCSLTKWKMQEAAHYGDHESEGYWYQLGQDAGCDPWFLIS